MRSFFRVFVLLVSFSVALFFSHRDDVPRKLFGPLF